MFLVGGKSIMSSPTPSRQFNFSIQTNWQNANRQQLNNTKLLYTNTQLQNNTRPVPRNAAMQPDGATWKVYTFLEKTFWSDQNKLYTVRFNARFQCSRTSTQHASHRQRRRQRRRRRSDHGRRNDNKEQQPNNRHVTCGFCN